MWGNIQFPKSACCLCLTSSFLLRARTRADAREGAGTCVSPGHSVRSTGRRREVVVVFDFFCIRRQKRERERERERNSIMTGTQQSKEEEEEEDVKEKEEEEETCGFCAYMKGGSCKRQFVEWEKCVDDAKSKNEDFVQKCFEQTAALRECMLKDPEYYGEMDAEEEEEKEKDEEKPDEKKKKKKTEE